MTTMDLAQEVISALRRHRAVRDVQLVGSRRRGDATQLSDWDFKVEVDDFHGLARDLPEVVSRLKPLGQQWDRLSVESDYMLMLRGGIKVDLIFSEPFEPLPPWEVDARALPLIDHHFWDWILWLAGKNLAGKEDLVRRELEKMSSHLLQPMGVASRPSGIEDAVSLYTSARRECERRFGVVVPKEIGQEVLGALRRAGHSV